MRCKVPCCCTGACNTKYGGPSYTKETCKSCGEQWARYRGGSYDWKYEDCFSCQANKIIEENKKLLTKLEDDNG